MRSCRPLAAVLACAALGAAGGQDGAWRACEGVSGALTARTGDTWVAMGSAIVRGPDELRAALTQFMAHRLLVRGGAVPLQPVWSPTLNGVLMGIVSGDGSVWMVFAQDVFDPGMPVVTCLLREVTP